MRALVLPRSGSTQTETANLLLACSFGGLSPQRAASEADLVEKATVLQETGEIFCVVGDYEALSLLALLPHQLSFCKKVFVVHNETLSRDFGKAILATRDLHCLVPSTGGINATLAFCLSQMRAPRRALSLLAHGAEQHSLRVFDHAGLTGVLNSLERTLEGFFSEETETYKGIVRGIVSVADELIMNSVFSANPRFNKSPTPKTFELSSEEAVTFSFGVDANLVVVSVQDPFGALAPRVFLDHLLAEDPLRTMGQKAKSAGVGLKRILRDSSGVVAQVFHRHSTEVSALFHVTPSLREMQTRPKLVGFF